MKEIFYGIKNPVKNKTIRYIMIVRFPETFIGNKKWLPRNSNNAMYKEIHVKFNIKDTLFGETTIFLT